MFAPFLEALRREGVPVSLREYLDFLAALAAGLDDRSVEGVHALGRLAMVKDERHLDRYDRAFAAAFAGLEAVALDDVAARALPEDWLKRLAEKVLTPEEMAQVQGAGSFEELMRRLAERLAEQEGRHQGGSKWIGTAGTSPFGAYGYNPEGVRIGQAESRHRRAVKVWDRREFRDYDDRAEIGTRAIKVALRRLRAWARHGAADELDLPGTIRASADAGHIDIRLRPERRNAVRVLLLLDVGGSMDDHVQVVSDLFSAARSEFKHLETFYFHNCLYEAVWRDNRRRRDDVVPTWDLLHRYGRDWKLILVGDAAMSPYEILAPGGASEHWNAETGEVWLRRAFETWPYHVWLNPVPEAQWGYTHSTAILREMLPERMLPLTLGGLTQAMRVLG